MPELLRRESAILDLVRPALAPEFAVPEPLLFGRPGSAFPFPFVGHRCVLGITADHPGVPEHPGLARQIATLLSRLHAVPIDAAGGAGAEIEEDDCQVWTDEAREVASGLRGIERAVDAAIDWLRRAPAIPPRYGGPSRLIHNDLCPDHVIVNPQTGEVVGVIDWTDTALGDPGLDFTFLVTWRGWKFTAGVLTHYALPLDAGFRQRLDYQTKVLSLKWLDQAIQHEADVAKHIGWVRHAFADPGDV